VPERSLDFSVAAAHADQAPLVRRLRTRFASPICGNKYLRAALNGQEIRIIARNEATRANWAHTEVKSGDRGFARRSTLMR
jgi:hypothetical protein